VVKRAGHADVGDGLVDDLLQLDRAHAAICQCGRGENTELGEPAGGQDRGQLHHHLQVQVERVVQPRGVGVHLVEGKVVEVLDQLRVGLGQGGESVAEQLVMVGL